MNIPMAISRAVLVVDSSMVNIGSRRKPIRDQSSMPGACCLVVGVIIENSEPVPNPKVNFGILLIRTMIWRKRGRCNMKSTPLVIKSMMVLVSAFCLITWNGFSEVSAKGPGGSHRTTSNITQPTQGSPSTSSSNTAQDSKGSKGTKQQDYPTESVNFNYGSIKWQY